MNADARAALIALRDGTARFVEERREHPRHGHARRRDVAPAQRPIAAVVSCSDSRVPPEIVFDQGLGDLFVVRDRLEFEGYEVLTASDGLSGLEVLRCEAVDCVLLDIMMPRMDGLTFYKTIREEEKAWPVPPIIAVTAFSRMLRDEQRHLLGEIPVLDKPFDFSALLQLIRERVGGDQGTG